MLKTPTLLALLRRLDTVLAGVLIAVGLSVLPQNWACDEAGCESTTDRLLLLAFIVSASVLLVALLRRVTPWRWTRILALGAAAYLGLMLPVWLGAHGRWTVAAPSGHSCIVRVGEPRAVVSQECGPPSYRCEGPKFVGPADRWNPLSLSVCGYSSDTYGDRQVIYDCAQNVDSVRGFDRGAPAAPRAAPGCVSRID